MYGSGGDLGSYEYNVYYARYKIIITGKTADVYKPTSKGSTSYSKKTSTTNKKNAIMSYILAGDSDYSYKYKTSSSSGYTTRQKAIYYYWNTFIGQSGFTNYISGWKNSSSMSSAYETDLYDEAVDYAEGNDSTYQVADISLVKTSGDNIEWEKYSSTGGTANCVIDEDNMIGPFQVSFTGTISSITLSSLSSSKYTICNEKRKINKYN